VFKLTIEDDEGKTTVVPLARDELTIGRLEGNTIRLTERNVSRRHARLVRQNGALYIEDLSSFCGVRVNGAKIATATPLREGDEVQIGDYRIALRGERTTAAITDRSAVGDRPTMPSLPAVSAPMGTVGGSVAIPTRASVAAMAAQPAAPAEIPMVDTAPLSSGGSNQQQTPAPEVVLTPPGSPSVPIPPTGPVPVRKSPPQPQPVAAAVPQPLAAPPAPSKTAPRLQPDAAPRAQPPAAARPAAQAQSIAAVPSVSDAQPTIPIRALGDSVPDRTAGTAPARMFVLTTDLAGTKFTLDSASLVIGRTDENDIVLGHRSISRHHAKIVRDGDHYTIVDLQSANGVRVNGEDYERIELNPGDILELGHVKLRFVGPLETFVFKPQALGFRLPAKLAVGAAIGVVALFAIAIVMRKRHAVEAPPSVAVAAPEPAAVQPPPPAPEPAVAVPTPSAPAAASVTPAAIFAEAKQAAGAEDWEKSRATLDKLGTVIEDPNLRRDAATLRRRVDTEMSEQRRRGDVEGPSRAEALRPDPASKTYREADTDAFEAPGLHAGLQDAPERNDIGTVEVCRESTNANRHPVDTGFDMRIARRSEFLASLDQEVDVVLVAVQHEDGSSHAGRKVERIDFRRRLAAEETSHEQDTRLDARVERQGDRRELRAPR
jgi:pSer/pThr/pTyr-binding forkhead associated (FHA) protein